MLLGGPGIVSALLTKRRHDGDPTVATRRHAGAAHGRREQRFDARDREFRGWRGARSARRTARNRR